MSILSFNYVFLLLPISLAVFWSCRRLGGTWLALGSLTAASLVYCALERSETLPVILGSAIFNFLIALGLASRNQRGKRMGALLAAGILTNVVVLAWFKFNIFFLGAIAPILDGKWWDVHQVLLPLGLSYYTFQQIAYLVEIKRGLPPERNLMRYILYVAFFPKVVMGPIVRPQEFLPQLSSPGFGRLNHDNLAQGLTLFLLGLAKKTLLAGGLAPFADSAFSMAAKGGIPEVVTAWGGVLAYSLQLYFDFSGYTDMAMGAAHMFGLSLPSNFATPYRSVNIADFWRRWHMSLSFWLRDYVYFPLGGSRQGQARRYLNVMAVMLLCGLWHGTGWLFLLWGGLHGLFIIIHNLWQARAPASSKLTGWLPSTWRLWVARLFTFVCVSLAWVFFRSPSLSAAVNIFKGLVGRGGLVLSPGAHFFLLWYLACGLAVAWLLPEAQQYVLGVKGRLTGQPREKFFFLPSWRPSPPHLLLVLALGLWALGRLATGTTQFLYYQF